MIRRPLAFETAVGTYTWPRYALEYDPTQALVLAMIDLPGANYAFDQLGDAPAPKGTATHTLRFLLVGEPADINAEMDEMRRVCYLGARGFLVMDDGDGAQRRCTARITAMPQITLGTRDRQRAPVILTFIQLGDFEGETISDNIGITASPQNVDVNNAGNAVIQRGVITIQGPFVAGLKLTNTSLNVPGSTTPYVFELGDRPVATGDIMEIDLGAYTVRLSQAGGDWFSIVADVVLQDGQVGLFAFGPGVNVVRVEGAIGGYFGYEIPQAYA